MLAALGVAFLVGDERAVVRAAAIGRARLPTRFPVDFVSAEEGQVDARIAGGFHCITLPGRPVFVVARGHKDLVIQDQVPAPIGVEVCGVGNIVAVALQETEHGIFRVKEPIFSGRIAGREGPVVADFVSVGSIVDARAAIVEAVPAIAVVGLPGGVRCLEENV